MDRPGQQLSDVETEQELLRAHKALNHEHKYSDALDDLEKALREWVIGCELVQQGHKRLAE